MIFIKMTSKQADSVRTSILQPRQVGDVWILGPEVLDDPDHAAQHALLASFPQGEVEIPQSGDEI